MLRKALFEGPKAFLIPICNSNLAKVSIIKWYWNLFWTYQCGMFGITKYLKNACMRLFYHSWVCQKHHFHKPKSNYCLITIINWSQNCFSIFTKCFSEHAVVFVIPIINEKRRSRLRCSSVV